MSRLCWFVHAGRWAGRLAGFAALTLLALSPHLCATTWYVATTGSDANDGKQASPLATIQRGVDLAQPGDTVSVANGTYGPNGHYTCGTACSQAQYATPVTFHRSGTATAPITITAENKWGAILDCQLPRGYSGDGTDGVQACDAYFEFEDNAAYITIENFDITGGYWTGANVNGANHDIQFIGNHFHHIGNRYYQVPPGTSGYGITGVFAGTQSSNITWDRNEFNNIGRLPTPGQVVYDDYIHDHGIYLFNGPHTITNNIFYGNAAGWGVQVSPGAHDVTILNNTFAGANPQQYGVIMLWADASNPNTNIRIQNNILFGGLNYAIGTFGAYEVATLLDSNVAFGASIGLIDMTRVSGTLTLSHNRFGLDPMFVNSAGNDFHLQAGSPAIDSGAPVMVALDFDGNPRPLGLAFDAGAYESTIPPTISAPAGLVATAVSDSTVTLTWTSSGPPADAILVEASLDGVTFMQFTSLPGDSTSYSPAGLAANTRYVFRVRAHYLLATTPYSNTASAITLPAAPARLAAAATSGNIALTWTNTSSAGAILVEDSADGVVFTQIASLAGNATAYTSTGLLAGSPYYYRVRAQNSTGTSGYSNTASATVPVAPVQLRAGRSVVSLSPQLNVYWQDIAGGESGFFVFRSQDNVTFTQVAAVGADVFEYDDTSVAVNVLYYYYVVAYNVSGTSAPSNTDSSIVPPAPEPVPAVPGPVKVGQSQAAPTSQLNVYWVDNSDNEAGFKVFRSPDKVSFALVATVGAGVTEYDDIGLAPNTICYYYVVAYNASGSSAPSNTDWSCTVAGGC